MHKPKPFKQNFVSRKKQIQIWARAGINLKNHQYNVKKGILILLLPTPPFMAIKGYHDWG